jgi:hypothetical protein
MHTIRPWLYIGKFRETQDEELLHQRGIGAILQLADTVESPKIPSLYIPIEDGEPLPFDYLTRGVMFVRLEKARDRNLLIACGAGISRSVSVAVAALKEEENLTLFDAFRQVLAKHPQARPHMALWKSLCEYYDEDLPYKDIFKLMRQQNTSS